MHTVIAFFKKVGRSIFFKLLLTFIATAIVLVVAVGAVVRYITDDGPRRELIVKNLAQYSTFIADQIGSPPDLGVARVIADKLGMAVFIKTPSIEWSSVELELPETFSDVAGYPNVRSARRRGQLFVRVHRPAAEYLLRFSARGNWEGHSHSEILWLILAVVGVILTISYLVVRWFLKPLGWLTRGMNEVGSGHLDTTIPTRKHDELGDLAAAFNHMSARIRELVRSKQQLLLDVSHELRSPITRMKLSAEFIHDEKVRKQISSDLGEMAAMTTEILESERLASEQGGLALAPLDLTELMTQVVASYSGDAPGVTLLTNKPMQLEADAERLKIVFRNVIDNAMKYSHEQPRPVQIALISRDDEVRVTVEDFGAGIPESDQALIFEPFYRVDKSRHKDTGGYGLGLSLCRKIMRAHGGDISVRSVPGAGSKFSIVFPRHRK